MDGCGMVELREDVAIPVVGFHIPHKDSCCVPLGQIAWAKWKRDRLGCIAAEEEGEFRTMFLEVRARRMVVNLRTAHTREARFGLIGEDGRYLPGRSFEDCDVICGDYTAMETTWKGDARLGRGMQELITKAQSP